MQESDHSDDDDNDDDDDNCKHDVDSSRWVDTKHNDLENKVNFVFWGLLPCDIAIVTQLRITLFNHLFKDSLKIWKQVKKCWEKS